MAQDVTQPPQILIAGPEEDIGQWASEVLHQEGLASLWVQGHLQALARCDDQDFPLVLAAVEGGDIDGFELCRILRRRQALLETPSSNLILLGYERDREQLATSMCDFQDFLIVPCLDVELVWRVRRSLRARTRQVSPPPRGRIQALRQQDLPISVHKEIKRGSRRSDSIGLVVVSVQGWDLLSMNHGRAGAVLVEDILTGRMQELVRSSDTVFRIAQGRFILLLPNTGQEGVIDFVHRMQPAVSRILRHEALVQDEIDTVVFEGICVHTQAQAAPGPEAIQTIVKRVLDMALSNDLTPMVTILTIHGDRVHVDPEPQPIRRQE